MRLLSAGTSKPISSVAFSGDGALLAEAAHGGMVRVWDVAGGQVVHACQVPTHFTPNHVRVALSPDGRMLAIADDQVRLLDLTRGSWAGIPTPPDPSISLIYPFNGVAFSPDGRLLAAGGNGWCCFDVMSCTQLPKPAFPRRKGVYGTNAWPAFAFSADGTRLRGSTVSRSGRARDDCR